MKILKKFTAITTAAVLLTAGNLSVLPAGAVNDFVVSASASGEDIVASGNCGAEGDNLTWTLDSKGTLIISGTGAMRNYSTSIWDNYYVKEVIIQDGIYYIGNRAFSNCNNLTKVTIPDSVLYIGDYAFCCCAITSIDLPDSLLQLGSDVFLKCESLLSVSIPDSVTKMGSSVFSSCESLTEVKLSKNIKTIETGTFSFCESLLSVDIPDSVTNIESQAFWCCKNLLSVSIPYGVTVIDYETFYGCESLSSVSFSKNVKTISKDAFGGCNSISEYNVDKDNPYYTSVDGILFDKEMTTLHIFPPKKNATTYTVPDSVTKINSYAFDSCEALVEINLHDNITEIGTNSFQRCRSLTSIEFPSNLQIIPSYACSGCTSLKEIVFPECTAGVSTYAFSNCDALESVTIPKNIAILANDAFYVCKNLASVTIENPECVLNLKNIIFSDESYGIYKPAYFDGTIYGYTDSTAQKYAKEHDINFVALDAEQITTTTTTTTSTTTTSTTTTSTTTTSTTTTTTTTTTSTATTTTTTTTTSRTTTTTTTTGKIVTGEFSDYGSDLTFNLDGDGNLTVEGEVSAEDWEALPICPWDGLQEDITAAVIEEKVAYIGEGAFTNCTNLTSITIKNPECEIYDSADTISDTATIYGYAGSPAEDYAEKYDREFVDLSIDLSCDITGDGVISASDATIVLNAYTIINSGKKSPLTAEQTKAADVDKDGKITGSDATLILRYCTKLSSLLGGEKIPTFKEWFESVKTE